MVSVPKEHMSSIFIIAEAGVNHNGDLALAKKMIDVAATSGADAVKFQAWSASRLVTRSAAKATYQIANTGTNESQFAMLEKLELPPEAHRILIDHCASRGIAFLCSPFDIESVHLLHELGVSTVKIPSGEITNLPYLREIGKLNKNIILSSGMATLEEVRDALQILIQNGTAKDRITVLHCTTDYPTAPSDVNMRAMHTLRDALGVKVGYSDHTLGIEIPIFAAALGAEVIEKHFTLDRGMPGPDHKASLEPEEFKTMVTAIRTVEKAVGDGVKKPTLRERVIAPIARKSIVAKRAIEAGEKFSTDNITTKRPGNGVSPLLWDSVLGQQAKRAFNEDDLIEL